MWFVETAGGRPLVVQSDRRLRYALLRLSFAQAPHAFRADRIAEATFTHEPVAPRSIDAVLPDLPFDMA